MQAPIVQWLPATPEFRTIGLSVRAILRSKAGASLVQLQSAQPVIRTEEGRYRPGPIPGWLLAIAQLIDPPHLRHKIRTSGDVVLGSAINNGWIGGAVKVAINPRGGSCCPGSLGPHKLPGAGRPGKLNARQGLPAGKRIVFPFAAHCQPQVIG